MSLAGLSAALFLTLLALIIVAYPLLRRHEATGIHPSSRRDLETEYQRALTNIRDLDEDFATGKLSAQSYHEEREAWAQRGIELLRQLDEQK
ncbi:MAG: c-type cytochrome biogenesis protein CcmI [Chloroflexi bacterium]|nr:c-type cytochrome biogenesis protein CcmI [Chloroflexota bacterium]MCY4248523.1 c-type cytochrome biogenesis protein CcmI [Chloroflexota bacterium]